MMLAMFPGQGSQFVGMGKKLCQDFKIADQCFKDADEILGFKLQNLCFEGPESDLLKTENTQPAILTHSIALWRVYQSLQDTSHIKFFAGHSLGEYSALVAAGVLNFSDALSLVRSRGKFMQEAVPQGVGAMLAVMLKDSLDLQALAKEAADESGGVCEIVNFNSKQQVVAAGNKHSIEVFAKKLEGLGVRSILLPVSAPFHSSLMAPARVKMQTLIEETKFADLIPGVYFVPNVSGELVQDHYLPEFLIKQIDSAVLWMQSIQNIERNSCKEYLEVGPGKVLLGLLKRILQTSDGVQMNHVESKVYS